MTTDTSSGERTLDFGAQALEHQFPPRDAGARRARLPLRWLPAENTAGPPDGPKPGASPIRRAMSIYAQLPNGPKTRTPRTPKPKAGQAEAPSGAAGGVADATTNEFANGPRTPGTPLGGRFMGGLLPSPARAEPGLQRQCAELYTQLTSKTAQCQHAEDELARTETLVAELTQKARAQERQLRALEDERRHTAEAYQLELRVYKDMIDELQRQAARVTMRLQLDRREREALASEHDEKYSKLLRSHRALQSNFELEQNLKTLLIEQIEFLTKERELLLQAAPAPRVDAALGPDDSFVQGDDSGLSNSLARQNSEAELPMSAGLSSEIAARLSPAHGLQAPFSAQPSHLLAHYDLDAEHACLRLHLDSDSDGSVHGTHLLSAIADLPRPLGFASSSPIKDIPHNYLDVSPDFEFPAQHASQDAPAPHLAVSSRRRSSLPGSQGKVPQPIPNSSFEDDFVLSPLKLTPHHDSSYFETRSSEPATTKRPSPVTKKRYSGSRANHSRYNSHDIVPIKVEFEMLNQQLRSTSAPDKHHLNHLSSVAEKNPIEDTDLAFMRLNGFTGPSKRDSLMTESSKRSSYISDINILSGDITKQEITKLKFELQSLKLHNEKLLSYIGFELQKQKKNIKKLSSKQNLMPKSLASKMEYSDAKLIEKLREMLINKKRVLRSVSINPILSTKYGLSRNSSLLPPLVGLGVACNLMEEDDDFLFRSHFINSLKKDDCDDYGFLNHSCKYNLRVLLKKNQEYSEYNDEQTIKKYKSQTFGSAQNDNFDMSTDEEDFVLIDEAPEFKDGELCDLDIDDVDDIEHVFNGNEDLIEAWTSSSEESLISDVDYDKLDRFNQMKYLILGKEHMNAHKHSESIADENLKYKFLTIAIGIIIVGIKFTTHPQQQLAGN